MRQGTSVLYFFCATILVLFGFVAMFSIGFPFFFTGLAMFALWPLRSRRPLFFALLMLPTLFVVGYLSVAPMSCSSSATSVIGATVSTTTERTTCSAVFRSYSYQPSLVPALLVGLAVAATGAALIYVLVTWRERTHAVTTN